MSKISHKEQADTETTTMRRETTVDTPDSPLFVIRTLLNGDPSRWVKRTIELAVGTSRPEIYRFVVLPGSAFGDYHFGPVNVPCPRCKPISGTNVILRQVKLTGFTRTLYCLELDSTWRTDPVDMSSIRLLPA